MPNTFPCNFLIHRIRVTVMVGVYFGIVRVTVEFMVGVYFGIVRVTVEFMVGVYFGIYCRIRDRIRFIAWFSQIQIETSFCEVLCDMQDALYLKMTND